MSFRTAHTSEPVFVANYFICLHAQHDLTNVDVVAALERLPEQLDDVLSLDAGAAEPLGPLDEDPLGEPLLPAREGEGEAEREDLVAELAVVDEVGEALGDVVEEPHAGVAHQLARDLVDLAVHEELVLRGQLHDDDAEVGAAQVQREELAHLGAGRQLGHVP